MSKKTTADAQEMQAASGMLRFNAIKPKLLGAFESALPEVSEYES